MSEHTSLFRRYYLEGFWANKDGSSGPNSAAHLTPKLREQLARCFQTYNIRSLLDAGCGDANLFKHMIIDHISYTGLDCVPEMIAQNNACFAQKANMHFEVADVVYDDLPKADLILCRDVIHYVSNEMVIDLIKNCIRSGSRYLLITHNLYAPDWGNVDTNVGIFRPANLSQAPFSLPPPIEIYEEDEYGKALALWELSEI